MTNDIGEIFRKDPGALTPEDKARIIEHYKSHRHLFSTKAVKAKSYEIDDLVEEAMNIEVTPKAKPRKRRPKADPRQRTLEELLKMKVQTRGVPK